MRPNLQLLFSIFQSFFLKPIHQMTFLISSYHLKAHQKESSPAPARYVFPLHVVVEEQLVKVKVNSNTISNFFMTKVLSTFVLHTWIQVLVSICDRLSNVHDQQNCSHMDYDSCYDILARMHILQEC